MLSTAEAKYAAMANATKEAMWLWNIFCELGFKQTEPTLIFGDNQSALAITQSKQYHQWSKYFHLKHHYIREKVTKGAIKVQYCPTNKMIVDIFTKRLPKPRHEQHVTNLGLYLAWGGVLEAQQNIDGLIDKQAEMPIPKNGIQLIINMKYVEYIYTGFE